MPHERNAAEHGLAADLRSAPRQIAIVAHEFLVQATRPSEGRASSIGRGRAAGG
ncbi:MAG TPA: hypothetical protein VI755_10350 [Anaerolineales bacterium]|nr:hypothetical protein [Anaerolineales bacterium]